jgi:hypothetical protein
MHKLPEASNDHLSALDLMKIIYCLVTKLCAAQIDFRLRRIDFDVSNNS